jgi:hypothetical protein
MSLPDRVGSERQLWELLLGKVERKAKESRPSAPLESADNESVDSRWPTNR